MTVINKIMSNKFVVYCDHMADVRTRLNAVQGIVKGEIDTGSHLLNTELIFLQLRKSIELIAFTSLVAHQTAYSAAHRDFAKHWNAKRLMAGIEKLNPDFYPMALNPPQEIAPGQKHFPRPLDGFMTKDEFIFLYDACSKVLHSPNPYNPNRLKIDTNYSVSEWLNRIQRLLTWHRVKLVDNTIWIVNIPEIGDVQGWPADPLIK